MQAKTPNDWQYATLRIAGLVSFQDLPGFPMMSMDFPTARIEANADFETNYITETVADSKKSGTKENP